MKEAYKLAVLANELGDISDVAELTGISESLIEKAIESIKGTRDLTNTETQDIKNGYNSFYRSRTLSREHLRDVVTPVAEQLKDVTQDFIGTDELKEKFTDEFVYGSISPDLLDLSYDFFNNLSISQQIRLSEWINEDAKKGEMPHQIAYFLQLVEKDIDNNVLLYDHEKGFEKSDFWKWFRETFYNE